MKPYEFNEEYDKQMDGLTIRQQNERIARSVEVQDMDPGKVRKTIGWTLYWIYVVLQFVINLLHDIAILIRDGKGATTFRIG